MAVGANRPVSTEGAGAFGGGESGQMGQQVREYTGIGVLVDGEAGAGVETTEADQALPESAVFKNGSNGVGDVD